ncbi:hypothetical protein CIB48_g8315 [Xylaria polymorpha]|nr:hypothetical protein CIB48_g8315 [Xylaria polymorpha]
MAHMTNSLATIDQLYRRTASFSALPSDLQDAIFFATQSLTQAAGLLLRLPQSVTAQASVVLARHWLEDSLLANEFSDVSAASLFLVAKLSAHPCRPRDVCNVYAYLLSAASPLLRPKPSPPEPDPSSYYLSESAYTAFQARILQLEARILARLLRRFITHKDHTSRGRLSEHRTALPPDALPDAPAHALAVAAIYSAARDTEISAKMPECPWWEVFDVDREELGFLVVAMRSLEGLVGKLQNDFKGFNNSGMITRNDIDAEMTRRGLKITNGADPGTGEVDEEEAMMRSLDDRAERMGE